MKKYDTVIFDLDETLLNTLEDLTNIMNFTLSLYDFPCRKIEEVRSFVGNGVARLMELCIPEGIDNPAYEKCLGDFRRHYSGNMQNKTDAFV
ncbi:MAG: family hydrolase [Clostridiaceae bacterium]|jgi:phosphoglycolate phosphatase|nr:family hydrolase [Clostridiaceae bacterium]